MSYHIYQRRPLHTSARVVLVCTILASLYGLFPPTASAAGQTFYIDCDGRDSASGTSPEQAWRSLAKANAAPLTPGDTLSFKRGCTWEGEFDATWEGTAAQPIIINAYGLGDKPKFIGKSTTVSITGRYQILEYLEVTGTKPSPYRNAQKCKNQPTGWRGGFEFNGDAQYNTVRHSRASGLTVGIRFGGGSNNRALYNELVNNTTMSNNTPPSERYDDDSGAWGVLLNADNNEVAYNYFSGNVACSEDYGVEGASIEVYQASNNYIHHNTSINDTTFTELGGTKDNQSENNVYAYNLYAPVDAETGHFLTVRGTKSKWGGNPGTEFYNNTGYWVDLGISCSAGCDETILSAHNNIIWSRDDAPWSAFYASAPINESNNIFWRADGDPGVNVRKGGKMDETSRIINPQFVNIAEKDFRLRSNSPAIDTATEEPHNLLNITGDVEGNRVPTGRCPDIGAFEYIPEQVTSLAIDPPIFQFHAGRIIFLPLIAMSQPCT
ncbi:MAG: discoidin domain-containing protein [Chloroflexi bacterium AL-W]|nr:discoidin domain-containing protein [Chloroflexi bacterium AL-N1]NOK66272.1 discoidin domain-containing protein [Chloroflexi bacterium AL-N10]NOK73152.1 discoidin domain-containing protein [Chloroflexi bacterium AL-N5]NOK80049.1 discoidin domain-containing protein [Chloroflexi bacterium AL-W]NOK88096.1 discoidin domain-containing protein [Chloroflexi bacterium AL-N15]